MRKKFYIFLFFAGLHFFSNAQAKPDQLLLNNTEKTVKFYPNPAVNFINFEFSKNYDNTYNIIIFNFLGKKIEELKVTDIKMTVSVADFYRGVYIFQLQDSHGNIVETGKFQVIN